MPEYIDKFLREPGHSKDVDHYFIDLRDTPTTYTGSQNYVVTVIPTESGVQFSNVLSNIGFDTTVSGVYPIEEYDLATKGYVDDAVVSISGALSVGDLPCLQIRRTTDYTFNTTWEDITFNVTDIENKPDIIEHDNTNTDRILIKEDGFYKITYTMPIHPIASATFQARMHINDATVVSGSWMWVKDSNDTDEMSNDFIAELSAGDFITLQLDADCNPGDGYARADIVVTVIKLEGMKGDDGVDGAIGPAGAGSTLNIYKDGTLVTGSPFEAINFANFDMVEQTSSGVVTVSGSSGGESVSSTLAAVQARRTTTYTLTSSYVDITFDITDEETDSVSIEHNDTNTDRIDIKSNGTYLITYNFDIDAGTTAAVTDVHGQIRKNDTSVLNGSHTLSTSFSDSSVDARSDVYSHLSNTFIATLSSGDFISLQLKYSGPDAASTFADGTLTITKLQGIRGDKGDTGSGTSINLQDEGSNINNTPHTTLNFVGDGVSVSDSGSGVATITVSGSNSAIVFGSEFQEASSDSESSTTSESYQQKLRLTTSSLPSGTYRIGWYGEIKTGDQDKRGVIRVELNNTTTLGEDHTEPDNDNNYWSRSGFKHISLSGVNNIDLDFKCDESYMTTYIRRSRLEIWRVS